MQRLLTTVTLAAWLGYCAVSAGTLAAGAFAVARDGGAAETLPAFIAAEIAATGFLAMAGLFGAALFLLHVTQGARAVAIAEGVSLGALALSGLFLLLGAGPAGPPASATTTVFMVLASVLAVLVDRAITVDEEEEEGDWESFDAGLAAVTEAMVRQTRLYTPPYNERAGR
ncbi:hypothetical protein [Aureimonas glaciei]|uniref:Uncharacterized protein n=1 Tax=Aureimonas glaciei TaxID=1776957 RepID=A0A917DBD8_9HYPH|nr:hypothetical protein [Aureimonas glaciei]GGD25620.1 hypothetical protein GCM10011335_30690 [Aureimonas glaciei]